MESILEVKNLNVGFYTEDSTTLAVRDVSFNLKQGETLGLVGESGCGKSVTAFALLGLIYPPGRINSGQVLYKGVDLRQMSNEEIRHVRGKEIAIVFQEPMTSLNPVFKIGYQISETIKLHLNKNKKEAKEYAIELLKKVGIPNPDKRYDSYPHELSGGMRQRVMIAIALSANPSILIADEPTTALDVTIQAQILDLLLNIQEERKMSLLLITHDLGIVANTADRIAIMYAGEIVETATVEQIYKKPFHPYTVGLFDAVPKIGVSKNRLYTIPGMVPTVKESPCECVFYPRCDKKHDDCLKNSIKLIEKEDNRLVRCIRA